MKLRLLLLLAALAAAPLIATAQTPAAHPGGRTAASAVSASPALVDINSATQASLDALPGVGPARAKAIVANRPYGDKRELVRKKVLPAAVFDGIEDKIALVNINSATAADIARMLPNVGPVRAQQIVNKRPYATPQDMVTKGALSAGIFDGIKNLVTAGS